MTIKWLVKGQSLARVEVLAETEKTWTVQKQEDIIDSVYVLNGSEKATDPTRCLTPGQMRYWNYWQLLNE